MDKIIAVFSNRNQSMQFASYLKRMNIACKTVNTPRELSVSCGISVVFPANALKQAQYIIQKNRFEAFVNFFIIKNNGIFKKYETI